MSNMNRIFADFDDADPTKSAGRNDTITVHGSHVVEIESVRFKESDQYDAVYFLVDFKVIETSSDVVTVGGSFTWSHNMMNKFFGAANTKQFIASALGLDPKSDEAKAITRSAVEEAWSEEQPLAGETVKLKTQPKETKSGFPFVVHTWSPAE
jgi:hypothetical protein